MNFKQTYCQSRQRWLKKPINARNLHSWLIGTGSLTARLQSHYHQFAVKTVLLKYAKPFRDESALLQLPAYKAALVREVLLFGNHLPIVFAHSVLPRTSLRGDWHALGKLGNKPLGAALFANPKVKRSQIVVKKLSIHHPISLRLASYSQTSPLQLWARRSVFQLNGDKILVTEVFLEQLKK